MEKQIVWTPDDFFCNYLFYLLELRGRRPIFFPVANFLNIKTIFNHLLQELMHKENTDYIYNPEPIGNKDEVKKSLTRSNLVVVNISCLKKSMTVSKR